jgi:hypothetical protein
LVSKFWRIGFKKLAKVSQIDTRKTKLFKKISNCFVEKNTRLCYRVAAPTHMHTPRPSSHSPLRPHCACPPAVVVYLTVCACALMCSRIPVDIRREYEDTSGAAKPFIIITRAHKTLSLLLLQCSSSASCLRLQ